MIIRRQGRKTLYVLLFTLVHRSLSYLHDASINKKTFTLKSVLPPLAPLSKDQPKKIDEVVHSTHCSSVPVVYTNDPESISLWLSENVSDGRGGIIGFDTEISRCRNT